MSSPRVVHCKRAKFDIYIGRGSKWGNPFHIGADGSREQVIEKYEKWILSQEHLLLAIKNGELRGKILGCFCAPKPCHGEVLVRLDESAEAWEKGLTNV